MVTQRPDKTSLDKHYLRINSIYLDRNFYRTRFSIFSHLCEIVGGLSLLASGKNKTRVDPKRYIAKALAWWMSLCGKVGVRSVEDMVWAKFPAVCPYCHSSPHDSSRCKKAKRFDAPIDWEALAEFAERNASERPHTIREWQRMFSKLYPCGDTESYEMTFARFTEEVGELAESLRAFPVAPGYFLSEAADMFAWLMHLHALYQYKDPHESREAGEVLERRFEAEYPAHCNDCGNEVCTCPPILPRTLGRIANDTQAGDQPFAPGGALLPTEDALALFQLGERIIRFGDEEYEATGQLLREIHSAVLDVLEQTTASRTLTTEVLEQLQPVLQTIRGLTASQRITQRSIDQLAKSIAELPSESRSTVLNLLTGAASGAWVAALVKLIETLAG